MTEHNLIVGVMKGSEKSQSKSKYLELIYSFFNHFIYYLFIFGCVGSLLLLNFSPVAASKGYNLIAVLWLLTVMSSLVAKQGFQGRLQ